jgi:DNA-binding Lrp family transcriptional regulator
VDLQAADRLLPGLLNDWQRGFPLVDAPFDAIAAQHGVDGGAVVAGFRTLLERGAISRIGGVFGAGAGGSALLCALAVPAARLEAVAAIVSAQSGVNHNYEREHAFNLWFVATGADAAAVAATLARIEAACGLRALRLPMQRAYRIDLGFDLRRPLAPAGAGVHAPAVPVAETDRALAACVEQGLPLLARPYDAWGRACGRSGGQVQAVLARWLAGGTLRRFGAIVRHHEAGFGHNAMAVFDLPDASVDACGERLARQRGVTLAYRRARAEGWPYNLYGMVHGRERAEVLAAVQAAARGAGIDAAPHAVLFSGRRFKQIGASYFRGGAGDGGARAAA